MRKKHSKQFFMVSINSIKKSFLCKKLDTFLIILKYQDPSSNARRSTQRKVNNFATSKETSSTNSFKSFSLKTQDT